jgi:polar amino acid transport system substrate-binding protein
LTPYPEVPVLRPARSLPTALAAAALSLTLAGCGGGGGDSAAPQAAGGVDLITDGQLTTCTQIPYEPFQFRQGDQIVGFDVEIVDLVAAKLGVKQQIVETPFDNIQSGLALNSGLCDIGAAAMTITEERDQNLDFSAPYFDATQALLVPPGSDITGAAQLTGRKLGVQNGTTGQDYATANIAGAEQVVFEDIGLLLTAVQTGQVDAAINDNAPLLDFANKNAGFTVTEEFDTGEEYGLAIRTGNTALLEQANAALEAARADGSYDRIFQKWFKTAPPAQN